MYGCRFHTLQLQGMLFKLWREAVFCLCDHVRWLCYTIPTYGFPLPFWCSTMQAVLSPCCRHRVWDLVLLLLPAQVHTMSYWGFSQVEYKPFRLQSSCLENRRKEVLDIKLEDLSSVFSLKQMLRSLGSKEGVKILNDYFPRPWASGHRLCRPLSYFLPLPTSDS